MSASHSPLKCFAAVATTTVAGPWVSSTLVLKVAAADLAAVPVDNQIRLLSHLCPPSHCLVLVSHSYLFVRLGEMVLSLLRDASHSIRFATLTISALVMWIEE